MNSDSTIWKKVDGIDCDGPTSFLLLQRYLSGKLTIAEQHEVLANLYRDGTPSSAGYAAVPILLQEHPLEPRSCWDMSLAAGMILASINQGPPVPLELETISSADMKKLCVKRLLGTAANSNLNVAQFLETFAVLLGVMGRQDLRDLLETRALHEHGLH